MASSEASVPTSSDQTQDDDSLLEAQGQMRIQMSLEEEPFSWRTFFKYAGPGMMVGIGYMDPGNWTTDIEAGARFKYRLVWVIAFSNIVAVLFQTLVSRVGIITQYNLAELCRMQYPRPVAYVMFFLTEIAIIATDLAEVLGSAIGLEILFGIPLSWGVALTVLDTFLLLAVQRYGLQKLEWLMGFMIVLVSLCFVIQLFVVKPQWGEVFAGLVPRLDGSKALYVACGILGATVMPHNFYLHSGAVTTRKPSNREPHTLKMVCKYNFLDIIICLCLASFVNAAILIVAGAKFFEAGVVPETLNEAHHLLGLPSSIGPIAFGVALIASGQSSTVTGTLAGQYVVEGFLNLNITPWIQQLLTRLLAIVPALVVIAMFGPNSSYQMLILSQVILSLQLPFCMIPLIKFTGSEKIMGEFATNRYVSVIAWIFAILVLGLNIWLVIEGASEWPVFPQVVTYLILSICGILVVYLIWKPTAALKEDDRQSKAYNDMAEMGLQ